MVVGYSRQALKGLRAMPRKDAKALIAKIAAVAADPKAPHLALKPLTGRPGYRLRQGDWRAVLLLDGNNLVVEAVAHRREVYR